MGFAFDGVADPRPIHIVAVKAVLSVEIAWPANLERVRHGSLIYKRQ